MDSPAAEMITKTPPPATVVPTRPALKFPTRPAPRRRPWRKALMQSIRRGHLYLGLFLLPWVFLYGVTAFLFNHPAAFSDQAPVVEFGKEALAGTPLESPPAPAVEAGRVVEALNARARDGAKYTLIEPDTARYARAVATVTARDGVRELTASVNVLGSGGSIRVRTPPAAPTTEAAPFAIAGRVGGPTGGRGGPGGGRAGSREGGAREGGAREGGRGEGGAREGGAREGGAREGGRGEGRRGEASGMDSLTLANPLHERVRAAAPVALGRVGFSPSDLAVTATPDLTFTMSDGKKVWSTTYNALAGSVSGRRAVDTAAVPELSARRFLTRLHTTHGYSDDVSYRWVWALIVDVMAAVMVFWGASGMLMWWQIKSTRRIGVIVVVISIAAAAWLGLGMHELFVTAAPTGRGG